MACVHSEDYCVSRMMRFWKGGSSMKRECPEIEMLAAYVDHNVTAEEQRVLEAHFGLCALCRRTVVLTFESLGVSSRDLSDSE